jgi:radical SAM protein with 4Fe4S-binding SPASM domain
MSFDGFPYIVGWELTLTCNLSCRHCGSSAGRPRHSELSLEEALDICEQFPSLLVREVDLTGGEPILWAGWPKLASRLSDKGIITKIITNGWAVTPDVASIMKDVGISGVGFSLDGMEETHDFIRNRSGSFLHVVKGIQALVEREIPVTVITTVHDLNVRQLSSLSGLLRSLRVEKWQVQPLFPLGRSRTESMLKLSEDNYLDLGRFVRDFTRSGSDIPEIETADSYGYFSDCDICPIPWKGCPAGLVSCGITSDGHIKGCLSMPDDFIEGDIRKSDLWSIWFRPGAFAMTRGFSSESLGENCRGCEKSAECQGGCTTMSIGYTGKAHNDPYCFIGIQRRREIFKSLYGREI